MSARDFYLQQEAKKGFRGWTIDGLDFLLQRGRLQEDVERECREALHKLTLKSGI